MESHTENSINLTTPTALRDVIADALAAFRSAERDGSAEDWADYGRLTAQAAGFGRDAYNVCVAFLGDRNVARREVAAKIIDALVAVNVEMRRQAANELYNAIAKEPRTGAITTMLMALGQARDERTIAIATSLIDGDNAAVSVPAIVAMTTCQQDGVLDGGTEPLLSAMDTAKSPDVRKWATRAIGSGLDINSSEVSAALARRLFDQTADVREEAILGLARRQDGRAFDAVDNALRSEEVSPAMLRAASLLNDTRLQPALDRLRAHRVIELPG